MDLEGIMLSEISQTKTNTVWFHSYLDFKKQNKWTNKKRDKNPDLDTEDKLVVARREGDGVMGEVDKGG